MASFLRQHILNFDIDTYLNPIIPPNPLGRLPRPISRWLGYRPQKQNEPSLLVQQLFAFLGTLLGLLIAGSIYKYAPGISKYNPPVIIASLGASAILEYNAITTPLSQPRNAILGHSICAVIGVGISKAFQQYSNFDDLRFVAAALACALGCFATGMTKTVHPPGGATAVLACVEAQVIAMGWSFVAVILVGVCVMMGVAFITNNIARQYPVYWWSPNETGSLYKRHKETDEEEQPWKDGEAKKHVEEHHDHDDAASETTLHQIRSHDGTIGIHLFADHLTVPPSLHLSPDELAVLQHLQARLQPQILA